MVTEYDAFVPKPSCTRMSKVFNCRLYTRGAGVLSCIGKVQNRRVVMFRQTRTSTSHARDVIWDGDKVKWAKGKELTPQERKDNSDIL